MTQPNRRRFLAVLAAATVMAAWPVRPAAAQNVDRGRTIRNQQFAEAGPLLFWSFNFDQVMGANDLTTALPRIADDPVARTILDALGQMAGIPSGWTSTGLRVLAQFRSDGGQEGQTYWLDYPAGYTACQVRVTMGSMVPNDGDRGATLLTDVEPTRLVAEAWTPRRGFGQGRSWVEAQYRVVLARTDAHDALVQQGACARPAGRLFHCRGRGTPGRDLATCQGEYRLEGSGQPPLSGRPTGRGRRPNSHLAPPSGRPDR